MEIRSIAPFLDYWRTIRGRTRRVVACIPRDQIEWSPHPGKFTFGDLVRHLATIERYMYAETVAGRPSRYAGCGRHGMSLSSARRSLSAVRYAAPCQTTPTSTTSSLRGLSQQD